MWHRHRTSHPHGVRLTSPPPFQDEQHESLSVENWTICLLKCVCQCFQRHWDLGERQRVSSKSFHTVFTIPPSRGWAGRNLDLDRLAFRFLHGLLQHRLKHVSCLLRCFTHAQCRSHHSRERKGLSMHCVMLSWKPCSCKAADCDLPLPTATHMSPIS